MTEYRDELEAMAARNEALQRELDEKRREVDALRGAGSPSERLDKLARDLAAAQVELASLRGPQRSPPSRALGVLAAASIGGASLAAAAFLVAARPVAPHVSPVHAPAPIQTGSRTFGVDSEGQDPFGGAHTPAPIPPVPSFKTAWKAKVRAVHG